MVDISFEESTGDHTVYCADFLSFGLVLAMDQALADLQAGQADLQKRFMLLSTAFAHREAFDTLNSEVQTIGAALVAVQTAQASFGQGQNEILQFVRTIQEA